MDTELKRSQQRVRAAEIANGVLGCTRPSIACRWEVILPSSSAHLECGVQLWAPPYKGDMDITEKKCPLFSVPPQSLLFPPPRSLLPPLSCLWPSCSLISPCFPRCPPFPPLIPSPVTHPAPHLPPSFTASTTSIPWGRAWPAAPPGGHWPCSPAPDTALGAKSLK